MKVTELDGERIAGFSGVASCGSPWACPVCSHRIASVRAESIATAVERFREKSPGGGQVAMVTLTMRHRRGQSLSKLWDALAAAWGKVTSGREWLDDQARWGELMTRRVAQGRNRGQLVEERRVGYCRVVEVTNGANGWHVHVHALVFCRVGADVQALGLSMFRRWEAALVRRGLDAPSLRHGVDVQLLGGDSPGAALGAYFSKATYGLALEVAGGSGKTARMGNRAPFDLLRLIVQEGDADALDLWREFEGASKGRRQLTWSTGLRNWLAVEPELTDEEIVAEDELNGEVILTLTAGQWAQVRAAGPELLEAAEADRDGTALGALLARLLPNSGCAPGGMPSRSAA